MRKHGSVIHFHSEGLGQGTTFYFAVPMYVRNRTSNRSRSSISASVEENHLALPPNKVQSDSLSDSLFAIIGSLSDFKCGRAVSLFGVILLIHRTLL